MDGGNMLRAPALLDPSCWIAPGSPLGAIIFVSTGLDRQGSSATEVLWKGGSAGLAQQGSTATELVWKGGSAGLARQGSTATELVWEGGSAGLVR
jgi:hypothetical protein